jgi:hypothetical protein
MVKTRSFEFFFGTFSKPRTSLLFLSTPKLFLCVSTKKKMMNMAIILFVLFWMSSAQLAHETIQLINALASEKKAHYNGPFMENSREGQAKKILGPRNCTNTHPALQQIHLTIQNIDRPASPTLEQLVQDEDSIAQCAQLWKLDTWSYRNCREKADCIRECRDESWYLNCEDAVKPENRILLKRGERPFLFQNAWSTFLKCWLKKFLQGRPKQNGAVAPVLKLAPF